MSKSLVAKGESNEMQEVSPYRALSMDAEEYKSIVLNNLLGDKISVHDLDKVTVPSGGGIAWEIPTVEGLHICKDIEGIILYARDIRNYWQASFSSSDIEDKVPLCHSDDCVTGIGEPGGDCATCPLAQFGSRVSSDGTLGKGSACRKFRLLLMLRENDMLPIVIQLSPTSVENCRKYFLRLPGPYQSVVTRLSLKKDKNSSNIEFSSVTFEYVRKMDAEEYKRAMSIASLLR